jgi:ribosomal RNA-processing protein 9
MTDRRRQRNTGSGTSGGSGGNASKKSRRQQALNFLETSNDVIASDDEQDDHDASSRASSSDDDEDGHGHGHETDDARKVRMAREYLQAIDKKTNGDDDGDDDSSQDGGDEGDDEEVEVDRIGAKLRHDRLKQSGMLQQAVANKVAARVAQLQDDACKRYASSRTAATMAAPTAANIAANAWIAAGHVQLCKGHDLTLTSVALQADGCRAISGSKDHSVILWDVEHAKRISYICPHWKKSTSSNSITSNKDKDTNNKTSSSSPSSSSSAWRTSGQILSVACSDDGRLAAVGARNGTVRIFDLRIKTATTNHNNNYYNAAVQTFTGHKGPVTALSFRTGALELFSASLDRCIRHYSLQQESLSNMMYLETLYGHQFGVTDIDCHLAERPVSVGMDRTARGWRLAQDTHLIFRGGSRLSWAESVALVRNDWFVTGHVNGELALWNMEKKRAVTTLQNVHDGGQLLQQSHLKNSSSDDPNMPTTSCSLHNSVVCVRALKESDLTATGSNDGYLRFWKVQTGRTLDERGLHPLCQVPLAGYLNDIAIGPEAKFAVVATGQEHRLGRFTSSASQSSASPSSSPTSAVLCGAKNRLAIVQLSTNSSGSDYYSANHADNEECNMLDVAPEKEKEEASSSDSESTSSQESR